MNDEVSFEAVAWLHVKAKPTSRLQERVCFKILRGNQPFIFQLQMVCLSVKWQTWLFIPKNMNEGKCCKACFLLWRKYFSGCRNRNILVKQSHKSMQNWKCRLVYSDSHKDVRCKFQKNSAQTYMLIRSIVSLIQAHTSERQRGNKLTLLEQF